MCCIDDEVFVVGGFVGGNDDNGEGMVGWMYVVCGFWGWFLCWVWYFRVVVFI